MTHVNTPGASHPSRKKIATSRVPSLVSDKKINNIVPLVSRTSHFDIVDGPSLGTVSEGVRTSTTVLPWGFLCRFMQGP